jgi:hypothetical protein
MKSKVQHIESPALAVEKSAVFRLGKDEMNLAEFPIALLTGRVPAGQKIIEYRDQIFEEQTGRTITRKLTIRPAEGTGLPTAVDDDVILALIQLTKANNGFTSRKLEFSRLDLIRTLGWPDSGASYKRLATSLERWLGISLVYENSWWDKRQQAWTTRGFHIIDNFELNDSRAGGGPDDLSPSTMLWNQTVFDSFDAGYLKSIDYDFYIQLSHPTARRMYRFLSKRMYHRPEWTFDLHDLAFEHIGLSRSYGGNAGKIKEKLQPAIKELEAAGFLEECGPDGRYTKDGKTWKIRLVRKAPLPSVKSPVVTAGPHPDSLIDALTARGVHRESAAELLHGRQADAVRHKLEVFDWLTSKADKRVAKNPAGYLISSIAKDYVVPKGFVPAAERQNQRDAVQSRESRATEERRRKREQEDRDQAEQRAIEAYWDALTQREQADLDAMAQAEGDPELLKLFRGPLKKLGVKAIRDRHIAGMLRLKGDLPPACQ